MHNRTLVERLKMRREAMEATAVSEPGDVLSEAEDFSSSSQTPMIPKTSESSSIGKVIAGESDSENILDELQTRRMKTFKEILRDPAAAAVKQVAPGLPPIPSGTHTVRRSSRDLELAVSGSIHQLPSDPKVVSAGDDTPRSMSADSSTLNASLRDRLRYKMRNRSTRSSTPDSITDRRLRSLRDLSASGSKIEERRSLPSMEEELDPYLVQSIASMKEWKSMKSRSLRKLGFPTEDEAYKFFVGQMDAGIEALDQKAEPPSQAAVAFAGDTMTETALGQSEESPVLVADSQDATKPDDKSRQFREQVTVDMPGVGDLLLTTGKHAYVPRQEQLAREELIYRYPSIIPALRERKVPDGKVPRNLEEEGFYVGSPPPCSLRNLSAMENRILMEPKVNYAWFDEDGSLKRMTNPLKEKATRPPLVFDEDLDPLLQLDWGKAEISPIDTRFIDEQGVQRFQLDVDVSSVRFSHHSLFSREHVLESRLTQLYNHFVMRHQKGVVQHHQQKLEALRLALNQLTKAMNIDGQKTEVRVRDQDMKRFSEYKTEIREARRNRNTELHRDRLLLMDILKTWQSIKQLRELQGYTNTPVSLKVFKEPTDRTSDEAQVEMEIAEELEEEKELHASWYEDQNAQYKRDLAAWKQYMKATKRMSQKKAQLSAQGINEPFAEDLPAEVIKPARPPGFDETTVLEQIKERLADTQRKPGEPIYTPDLQTGATITPTEQTPRSEQLRRAAMKMAKYYVKVLFNDTEVSRTQTRNLTGEFLVHFGEILNMQILHWPESIKLQLYDASSRPAMLMAELFIRIPESSMISGTVELDGLDFSSDHVVQYEHEGVGSGVKVDLNIRRDPEGEPPIIPLTSGVLFASASWGVDEKGVSRAPPAQQGYANEALSFARRHDALAALGGAGIVDLQKLLSWISDAKLDPNDPSNADILSLAKMARVSRSEGTSRPTYFRLNHLEEETEFATDEELNRNKRFRLIRLRDAQVPELKHYKMIPVEESFISDAVFDAYEKRLRGDDDGQSDGEVSHRTRVAKFLAKVRQDVHARSQFAKRQLDLEDMVIEDVVPDLGTIGVRILQLFEPRRPLKPVRRERKIVGGQSLTAVKDVKVLLNVVRAFDVPVRQVVLSRPSVDPAAFARPLEGSSVTSVPAGMFAGSHTMLLPQQSNYNPLATSIQAMVRPFVEVMFQGHFVRTSVADGPWPNWNEDLVLPFKSPNDDYTSDALQLVRDKIFINLFDEVIIDVLEDERQRHTNIHQRIEKHWLGSIEIPFSTVYFNSMVEGFLHVNSPPVLLGYQSSRATLDMNLTQAGVSLIQDKTYVQIFITIEPQLQPAQPIPERFETKEDDLLLQTSMLWLKPLRDKFPKRQFKTMVTDLEGKKVFVTRYIRAQKPPDELILDQSFPDVQKTQLLARFVSLIPYIADSAQFPDLCDIWATSDQFLHMLAGDEEEHAVLLCNYFLWLGKKAWVVLGDAIPEGSSAYVLSTDVGMYRLWNASTGESYDIQDTRSPLQRVGCLLDDSNIWANIQEQEHPSKLNLDLGNTKCWKPFFSKTYLNPGLGSVQLETLRYFAVDAQYAINIQDSVERALRDKLMEWRPRSVTKFNRYCTQAFRNLLLQMEAKMVTSGGNATSDHHAELEQVLRSHEVIGFPLQMPFVDIPPILERVYSTGVHQTEDPDVEFALAVHVHPYPNSVLAVWVYVGKLIRRP